MFTYRRRSFFRFPKVSGTDPCKLLFCRSLEGKETYFTFSEKKKQKFRKSKYEITYRTSRLIRFSSSEPKDFNWLKLKFLEKSMNAFSYHTKKPQKYIFSVVWMSITVAGDAEGFLHSVLLQ